MNRFAGVSYAAEVQSCLRHLLVPCPSPALKRWATTSCPFRDRRNVGDFLAGGPALRLVQSWGKRWATGIRPFRDSLAGVMQNWASYSWTYSRFGTQLTIVIIGCIHSVVRSNLRTSPPRFVPVHFSRFLRYLVVALTCFSGVRSFAAQQSNYPKACLTANATVPDGLYANDDADVNAEKNYERAIYQLLEQESFPQLDCLADSARKNKDRFSSGDWKLSAIYNGVAQPIEHATHQDWNARLLHVQHWVASNPKSITALIAQAQLYAFLAWEARGNGSSDNVSES